MTKSLVVCGYGINCEAETLFAFEKAGINGSIIHINELIKSAHILDQYQVLAFPGGFSYADQTGAGNAFALKAKKLMDYIHEFLLKDKLIIGICNGAQILTRLFCDLNVTFEANDSAQYQCEWVDLEVKNKSSPWLVGIDNIRLPIAHGEGKLLPKTPSTIKSNNLAAMVYKQNPNGSTDNIAAITAFSGKMLITMPHPERAIFFHQHDGYYKLREEIRRKNLPIRTEGSGMQIFKNAFEYFQ